MWKSAPDALSKPAHNGPESAEHTSDANHICLAWDSRHDLFKREPLDQKVLAVRIRTNGVESLAGAINDVIRNPGLFECGSDIGQPERGVWRVHLNTGKCFKPRRVDQCNHKWPFPHLFA